MRSSAKAPTRENFQAIRQEEDIFQRAALATDSGFHTDANVQALFEQNIEAYIRHKRWMVISLLNPSRRLPPVLRADTSTECLHPVCGWLRIVSQSLSNPE